ncbi:MAG: hypothetical protein IJY82_04500 [Oscillospiraceae bacterium]|nr:hypothetical protein [Oscillospiraceae bacterium]
MKKIIALALGFCLIFSLSSCGILAVFQGQVQPGSADALRKDMEKYEFLGVTFYLPREYTQSNIFADADTGRISYTDPQGITFIINVSETSFVSQYYKTDILSARDYSQAYIDYYQADASREGITVTPLSDRHGIPCLRQAGNMDATTQYGVVGFYCSGSYCATITIYTDNQALFDQQEEDLANLATIATFSR